MAFKDFLKKNITSQASFVEFGYGQVEPNHLSAQRTGQIYAQLPAAADIDVLEQGQFVKYDYENEVCDFDAEYGEWMLVFNEIKLYREGQWDCEFAMVKDNYQARIYSPYDYQRPEKPYQARFYNGKDANGNTSITVGQNTYTFDDVTTKEDYYEPFSTEDPFHSLGNYKERKMPAGTQMVPRVFKTNVGDIFTTNTVNETTLALGDELTPQAGAAGKGILATAGADSADMVWRVVKVYNMPDGQAGVKIMRVK